MSKSKPRMFNVPLFFKEILKYLKNEKKTAILKSLAIMAGPEHWLSLEAAAFLDLHRKMFGLDEILDNITNAPRWFISAEYAKIDLFVADDSEESDTYKTATVIEFKVIHNNKNFETKIREIRHDLKKPIQCVSRNAHLERWGIALLIYTRYYDNYRDGYRYLGGNKKPVEFKAFKKRFTKELCDNSKKYKHEPILSIHGNIEEICSLKNVSYIDPKSNSQICIVLLKRKDKNS